MSEIINLRLARKAKKRATAEQDAEENRTRHGRTKAEKRLDNFNAAQEERRHAGRRLPNDKAGDATKDEKP